MKNFSIETTLRVETSFEKWEKLEDMLLEKDIWFCTTDNEDGYYLVEHFGLEYFAKCKILTKDDVKEIKKLNITNILVVF